MHSVNEQNNEHLINNLFGVKCHSITKCRKCEYVERRNTPDLGISISVLNNKRNTNIVQCFEGQKEWENMNEWNFRCTR